MKYDLHRFFIFVLVAGERIRGRNNNPTGTTHRGRGRYPRQQPAIDILGIHGGNRHDDSLIPIPNFDGQQQQQQGGGVEPQPGSSRGTMYNSKSCAIFSC